MRSTQVSIAWRYLARNISNKLHFLQKRRNPSTGLDGPFWRPESAEPAKRKRPAINYRFFEGCDDDEEEPEVPRKRCKR